MVVVVVVVVGHVRWVLGSCLSSAEVTFVSPSDLTMQASHVIIALLFAVHVFG